MEQVQHFHEYLLRQRTQIRNHRRTLQEMKRCWKLLARADPDAMSREEYEAMYSTLLYEMTICWDEETNDVVLAKMWQRDVSAFSNLDFNRFCCSIFYFAEMWVQEITQDAYARIFSIIRTILSGHEVAPMPSSTETTDSAFKPTLESFDDAFDRERDMESMNLSIGKSIAFDADKYFQHFGSPYGGHPSIQHELVPGTGALNTHSPSSEGCWCSLQPSVLRTRLKDKVRLLKPEVATPNVVSSNSTEHPQQLRQLANCTTCLSTTKYISDSKHTPFGWNYSSEAHD